MLRNTRKCSDRKNKTFWGENDMQNMMGRIRRCAEDYNMIVEGDKIAVGVSGGKDSLTLLYLLAALRRYYPAHYELQAVTIDMGLPGMDFSPVAALCEKLEVPYQIKKTEIGPIIFDYRHEKNPCSMCAKMRRGALNDVLLSLGCNKIALGHHFDDAVETFLMSLLYEGRIGCFEPVTYLSRTGITQIRPMLYVGEQAITHFAEKYELPVVQRLSRRQAHQAAGGQGADRGVPDAVSGSEEQDFRRDAAPAAAAVGHSDAGQTQLRLGREELLRQSGQCCAAACKRGSGLAAIVEYKYR